MQDPYRCFLFSLVSFFLTNDCSQTYILESYPRQGAEANLIFNLIRNVFSYISPFFLTPFLAKTGYSAPFGLFAALTVLFFPCVIVLMFRGKQLRERSGEPGWSRD